MRDFKPLAARPLTGQVRVARPAPPRRVSADSPALGAMTDLRHNAPATIDQQQSMDAAHAYMIQRGIRLLLVLNAERSLAGIITATDILGDRPLKVIQERRIRHSDIVVADIMTPQDKLDALDLKAVSQATVGDIAATLRASGRQHLIVIDTDLENRVHVCGIFSRTQIERQLGETIGGEAGARSFAEFEAAIASH